MSTKTMNKSTSRTISPRHLGILKKLVVYPAVLACAYFLFDWYNAIPSCEVHAANAAASRPCALERSCFRMRTLSSRASTGE